jgi:hypothetical protein
MLERCQLHQGIAAFFDFRGRQPLLLLFDSSLQRREPVVCLAERDEVQTHDRNQSA